MVRITEDLVRKKAEHNEGEISSLEELSLHQQDIERIENLDKWCRNLKILYLQSNLIPKIENVGRLKKLEYLNLALNNVEVIENLEVSLMIPWDQTVPVNYKGVQGCESLQKLDLTVNFVGELTSLESLKDLYHFRELYLTGNPCSQYEGYRDYVIATLTGLQTLDGKAVEKSERILALQNYGVTRARIIQQQIEYRKQREKEKEEARLAEEKEREGKKEDEEEKKPGFDGTWYTDINEEDKEKRKNREEEEFQRQCEKDKEFWEEKTAFTPESRVKAHQKIQETKNRDKQKEEAKNLPKKPRRLFNDDGKPMNVNESKLNFELREDETDSNSYMLDLHCYKHLETAFIDVDVQPKYVRIVTKGKIFQLALDEEVNADASSCKRSQVTGHLLITMPKTKQIVKPAKPPTTVSGKDVDNNNKENVGGKDSNIRNKVEKLEVDTSARKTVDISNIVRDKSDIVVPPLGSKPLRKVEERPNSENFVDDPDVPPLE